MPLSEPFGLFAVSPLIYYGSTHLLGEDVDLFYARNSSSVGFHVIESTAIKQNPELYFHWYDA